MKFTIRLASFVFAIASADGQSVEIVSPNKAYTFAYGDAISQQIERDHSTKRDDRTGNISAIIPTPAIGSPAATETFDFVFPGLRFDAARNEFVAHIRHQERIPIAALHPNFPYAGYKLEPNAQIFWLNAAVTSLRY